MKRITIGILAHVDAGKTTLSEAMLYESGMIRHLGRVDRGDSFLDEELVERERGITVFSKQAVMKWDDISVTLLDTPGHVDFSAEMVRTLSVIDMAVLVISAAEGVQSHTETLWKLLTEYHVPVMLFVNKMDLSFRDEEKIMKELREAFGRGLVNFRPGREKEAFDDDLTMQSDFLLEEILQKGKITEERIAEAVSEREIFPVYFGSALKEEGVSELLEGLEKYALPAEPLPHLAARVFKISWDERGNRLTFLRLYGGSLEPRDSIRYKTRSNTEMEEKINEIRIYSGKKYSREIHAESGEIIAVTGLTESWSGMGIGMENALEMDVLIPYMTYKVLPGPEEDPEVVRKAFVRLAEEDPKLNVNWDRESRELNVQIMGKVQLEVLRTVAQERFGIQMTFDSGRILYKETVAEKVEGFGHFEPLRHYAEVHLLLEPGERGSGMVFDTMVSEDDLDRNWQRLILSHLEEKEHRGVLTGSPITDMKITLTAGRAHKAHTDGGDFRQATWRAVRNGLLRGKNILLEPWYKFRIIVPVESIGKVMADIQKMGGKFHAPEAEGNLSCLEGSVPASEMTDYPSELPGFTHGQGKIALEPEGYRECHNQEEVIREIAYDPESDLENTGNSVFVNKGSAEVVNWQDAPNRMHLPAYLKSEKERQKEHLAEAAREYQRKLAGDEELRRIFERTYGPIRKKTVERSEEKRNSTARESRKSPKIRGKKERGETADPGRVCVFVDGYNVLYSWKRLKKLAEEDYNAAREKLIDILCNYQGFTGCALTVVFDAYRVAGGKPREDSVHGVHVVFTAQNETADTYIERETKKLMGKVRVRVVTSDALVQMISLGHGAERVSSREFEEEVNNIEEMIRKTISGEEKNE